MLVLSRKPSESIRIGDDVTITVVQVKGNTVRLGITAPNDVVIVRQELLDRQEAALAESPSADHLPAETETAS